MRRLEGKTAVITGCNRGIGKAILERLASEGTDIIACTRTITEDLKQEYASISNTNNVDIHPIILDMSSEESVRSAAKEISTLKKPIHTLVNNAGIASFNGLTRTNMVDLKNLFQVNYFSVVLFSQLLLMPLIKAKGASIINIASVAALDAPVGNVSYGASKAALITMSKSISKELASSGIRVNCIAPGYIDTDMNNSISSSFQSSVNQNITLKRLGLTDEVANTVLFLASDEASYITGQTIRVDGGL